MARKKIILTDEVRAVLLRSAEDSVRQWKDAERAAKVQVYQVTRAGITDAELAAHLTAAGLGPPGVGRERKGVGRSTVQDWRRAGEQAATEGGRRDPERPAERGSLS